MADKTVVTELIVDARGATAGSAEYERAMRTAQSAIDRLVDREQAASVSREKGVTVTLAAANSVARVSSAYDRLRSALDPVVAAEIRASREMSQAILTVDAAVKRGVTTEVQAAAVIEQLRAKQIADLNRVRESTQLVTEAQTASVAAANDNAGMGQSSNVAAQLQDVFVTAQMGMNPLQIALQQGTQLSAVFGPMGAAGAVKTLGAAFSSLINPVSLITMGLVAAAAGAVQLLGAITSSGPPIEERLKAHNERLRDIFKGYGDIIGIIDRIEKQGQPSNLASTAIDAKRNLDEVTRTFDAAMSSLRDYRIAIPDALNGALESYDPQNDPFYVQTQQLSALRDELQAAKPDLAGIDAQFAALQASPADSMIASVAASFRDLIKAANAAQLEVRKAQGAIDALTGPSPAFLAALKDLAAIGVPAETDKDRVLKARSAGIGAAGDTGGRLQVVAAADAALQRLADEEARKKAESEARKAARKSTPAEQFADQLGNTRTQVEQLEMQNAAFGKSAFEVTKAATAFDLLAAAQKAGLEVTPEVQANIDALAERMANARVKAEGLQVTLDNRTVFEQLGAEIERLDGLLATGSISWETYGRAMSDAVASNVASTLGAVASLSAGLSSAFEDNKALSIATAVLKGAEAIASAYAEGNKYFGPAGGVAFAAIAAVTAAANVAAVAATTKNSKSIGGGGAGGGASPSVAAPAAAQPMSLLLNLHGNSNTPTTMGATKDLFESLNEAAGNRGLRIVTKFVGEN